MNEEPIGAESESSQNSEADEHSSSWGALFWVGIFSLGLVAGLALVLMVARSKQIDTIISSRPKSFSSQRTEPQEIDFSEQGILLVEYGGSASISPDVSPESMTESVEPAESLELEVSDDESTEPVDSLGEPSESEEPEERPEPVLTRTPAQVKPPAPKADSNPQFLVTPPGLPEGEKPPSAIKPVPQASILETDKRTGVEKEGAYQVVSGPFGTNEELSKIEQKLKDKGYSIRQQFLNGSNYVLVEKLQSSQQEALVIADEIALLGYEVTVKKVN